jgi:hypothetical protein
MNYIMISLFTGNHKVTTTNNPTIHTQQPTRSQKADETAKQPCQPSKANKHQFFGRICPPARHLHFMYACWAVLTTKRPNDQTTKRPNCDELYDTCRSRRPGPRPEGRVKAKKMYRCAVVFLAVGLN